MAVVYTGGTFDMFHSGHVDFLSVCKKVAGDDGSVVVALNQDNFVARFKGKPPICSLKERAQVLAACRYVDLVVVNRGDEDSTGTISKLTPNFILIGDDWAQRDYYAQMGFTPGWLAERNITLLYVPRQIPISSTAIKGRIIHGHLGSDSVSAEPSTVTDADAGVAGSSC